MTMKAGDWTATHDAHLIARWKREPQYVIAQRLGCSVNTVQYHSARTAACSRACTSKDAAAARLP